MPHSIILLINTRREALLVRKVGTPMDELLTVHEVAKRLRVDDTTVRRWVTSGVLDAIRLPHKGKRQAYRIRQTTLDKIIMGENTPTPTT
jgi:excisionase family DNA binding protein